MESLEAYVERYGLAELLSADLLRALSLVATEPGGLILRAGEAADRLLFFVEGRAKVYSLLENGKSLLASFYEPFEVLGDAELFAYDRWTLNVEAITATACLSLPAEATRKAADRNGRLFAFLCGRLGRKLATFNVQSAINLRYPVENRLASYLLAVLELEGRGGAAGPGGAESGAAEYGTDDLSELADSLGTSYRQLSRVVRRFREEGILEDRRGRIRVLSRERLEPLAREIYL